ncbi:mechanosensitive ion channel family protein [Thiorhodococcus mannitoliphagus]|uniref:Mechanosensitive ion channel family protein n=1 Tax=Thiorhodococcus mannitoliphagus TaxID=329406 RepID=A0A6P1DZM3_9GAMM|nr:mechanosensitive ion channel domain-containing protein [Thiorhodococcus mannitoliphagus]NEX22940.1 mechanosensitive ion channel family protein [Thiorhodococcus mannitoliphagus]
MRTLGALSTCKADAFRRQIHRPGTCVLGLLLLLAAVCPAWADQAAFDAAGVQARLTGLHRVDARLQQGLVPEARFAALTDEVSTDQAQAQDCISAQQAQTDAIAQQLNALGPKAAGASAQVRQARADLERQQTQATALLADCRLLQVKSSETLQTLAARQQAQLTSRLLTRGVTTPSLIQGWIASPPTPDSLLDLGRLRDRLGAGDHAALSWLGALALIGLVLGLLPRRRMRQLAPVDPERDLFGAVAQGIRLSLGRYLPGLAIGALWSLDWLIRGRAPEGWPLLADVAFVLLGYQFALVAIRAAFNPPRPASRYLRVPIDLSKGFARTLRWLALISLIGALLLTTPIAESASPDLLLVTRSIWGTLFIANLVWAVWLIRRLRGKGGVGVVRLGLGLALLGALGAEWLGYRNLSVFVGQGVVLTLVCLLLAWLVSTLGDDFIDSLDEGRHAWQRRLRVRLGVGPEDFIPGLFWLRILFRLLIWLALALAVLDVWGLPDSAQSTLLQWAGEGFSLGQVRIQPARVLIAILTLGVLLSLVSWIRKQLDRRLATARLEPSARETAVAMTGYGLMIAAGLAALSIAGFELQKLAIIAGALSVGIGFGLQNIVNNFVSGLILLFERPIRTGDWIIVKEIEGYVRRISIRSTQIQTFDRADVILPNSDLISNSVTNWMLRDRFGRLRVPVGVAYGSDLQRVRETLLRVAGEHPQVVQGSRIVQDPYVLFLAFGDSALDFELRVFVRDIGKRLTVLSDLNFAIDAAFREAGIEIPFPQRDVHLIRPAPPTPGSGGISSQGRT